MANKVKAMSPDEVADAKVVTIPDEVIEAVNELLVKHFDGSRVQIMQSDLVALICEKMKCTSDIIYNQKWLDFEPFFRSADWMVEYVRPGYNESYSASWRFSRINQSR